MRGMLGQPRTMGAAGDPRGGKLGPPLYPGAYLRLMILVFGASEGLGTFGGRAGCVRGEGRKGGGGRGWDGESKGECMEERRGEREMKGE